MEGVLVGPEEKVEKSNLTTLRRVGGRAMISRYKWAIVLTVALFTFVLMRQVSTPIDPTKWTYFDLIIVAAIVLILIWFYPDVRDIILRCRKRNDDTK